MIIKLSIITVCLNEVKNIERTLLSVVNQTWQDFEWIVVDGGSTDGTLEIIERYKNRIDILISEKDTSIYNAMNKGILKAKGEYCLFLNAGDLLYNNSVLQHIFEHCYTEDLIYGNLEFDYDQHKKVELSPSRITLQHLLKDTLWHPATFIKRKLFFEIGLYDENYIIAGDYDFFLRAIIANKKNTKYINLIIATYNMQGISSQIQNERILQNEREKAQKQNIDNDMLQIYQDLKTQIADLTKQNNILALNYNEIINSKPIKYAKLLNKIIHFNFHFF